MIFGLKRYIESDYSFNSSSTNSTMSTTHISDEQKNPVVVTGVSHSSTSSILSTSTPTFTPIQLEDQIKDARAKFIIMKNIDYCLIPEILNLSSAFSAWNHLKSRFGVLTRPQLHALRQKLMSFKMGDNNNMINNIDSFNRLLQAHLDAGIPVSDEDKICHLSLSAPMNY